MFQSRLTGNREELHRKTLTSQTQTIDSHFVKPLVKSVVSAPGLPQRKCLSPGWTECYYQADCKLKYVQSVSCVTQLSCVKDVTNAINVVLDPPVGARLQNFWQVWQALGASPGVVQVLREGYTLPFQVRPKLARFPTVVSCYVNPHRNSYLLEALHQLTDKNAIEMVQNQKSLGFFNRLFFVPKPNNKWRPILDLSKLNLFLKVEKFKMETRETIRTSLQTGEWVTSIDFKDAYFHIPIQEQSRKYLRFHVQGQTYQFKALPFGLSTAPLEFTVIAKEVKLMATHQGIRIHQYLDDWLVRATSHQVCLQHTQDLVKMCRARLAGELGEIRTGTQTNLRFRRLPIRPQGGPGPANTGPVAKPTGQDSRDIVPAGLSGPEVHVLDRFTNSHREASSLRPVAHENHTVASQKQLENTGVPGKGDTYSCLSAPSLTVVTERTQRSHRPAPTPHKACYSDLYRRIKRRMGRSFKRAHCKRNLVSTGKQVAHKLSRAKSSFSSSKRVPGPLYRPNSLGGNRQHHSGVVYKQGRRHEVGPIVCPTLENADLVYWEASNPQSPTHTRPVKCNSGQAIPVRPDHSDRMVPPSGGIRGHMPQVALPPNRPICHQFQQQTTSVCVPNARPSGHGSGRTQPALGGSGCICLSTNSHLGQSGGEVTGHPMQETYPHCPGVAQHAMVLGPSVYVQPDPTVPAQPTQSLNTSIIPHTGI